MKTGPTVEGVEVAHPKKLAKHPAFEFFWNTLKQDKFTFCKIYQNIKSIVYF